MVRDQSSPHAFKNHYSIKALFIGIIGVLVYLGSELWTVHFSTDILKIQFGLILASFTVCSAAYFSNLKLNFLVAVIDILVLSLYFYFVPSHQFIFVSFLSLNIILSGFFVSFFEVLFITVCSVFAMTLVFSLKELFWDSYSISQYVFNVISFLIYGVLAYSLKKFYLENKDRVRALSKDLFSQKEINNIVLDSISSSVLVHSPEKGLISENRKAQEMSLAMPSFFKDVLENIKKENYNFGHIQVKDRFLQYKKSKIKDGSEDVYLISDETEMTKAREELERSKKLAAIGKLSAGLAHEIRNPLAGISGSVELLKENLESPDISQRLFKTVLREIDRLNGLVTDFLSFTTPQVKKNDEVDINLFLNELVEFFNLDKKYEHVDVSVKAEEAKLLIDSPKLRQVFLNLILNSAQSFNDERVSSLKEKNDKPMVQLSGLKKDEFYIIKVEDNGCGIKKSEINHIFEPFHTTKDKGTGLGLALSHRILEDHGASTLVESEEGKGTAFIIKFKV